MVFAQISNVAVRDIANETIFVPITAGVGDLRSIYVANEWGTAVWKRIGVGATIAAITASLCEEYDVDPSQAEQDVGAFVQQLASVGLVQSVLPQKDASLGAVARSR